MNYLIFDTETTNDIESPLCYDLGFSIIDECGKIFFQGSYVVADIFLNQELMSSAFFKDKIPQYWEDIKHKKRILITWQHLKNLVYDIMIQYNVTYVIAHNIRFDYKSTTTTQRYLTCSKWRYFFPYGTHFIDTLKMARNVFSKDEKYIDFCTQHNFLTQHKKPRYTAEILYKYISNNVEFVESHTGLEDVKIETEIFLKCLQFLPFTEGLLWEASP